MKKKLKWLRRFNYTYFANEVKPFLLNIHPTKAEQQECEGFGGQRCLNSSVSRWMCRLSSLIILSSASSLAGSRAKPFRP